MFTTPSTRWAALESRDPLAVDAFIYCVKSTRIYCRPTCPSRLARRANIIFHDTCIEAAAAGFRPCKRCRPDSQGDEADSQKMAVKQACDLIQRELSGERRQSVKQLAEEVSLTESHFCRIFKKITGKTIGEYRKFLSQSLQVGEQMGTSSSSTPDSIMNDWILEDGLIDWEGLQECEHIADPLEDIDFSLFDEKWWFGQEVVRCE